MFDSSDPCENSFLGYRDCPQTKRAHPSQSVMTLRRARISSLYSTRGTTQIAENLPPLFRVSQPVDTNAVARDGSTCVQTRQGMNALFRPARELQITATVSVAFTNRYLSANRVGASSPSTPFSFFDTDNYITTWPVCQFFYLGNIMQNFPSLREKFCCFFLLPGLRPGLRLRTF